MVNTNNVLLLHAPVPGPHNRSVAKSSAIPPLGLGYLAGLLLLDNFDVRIVDMDMEDMGESGLIEFLRVFQPFIVGISATTLTFKNSVRISQIVKNAKPDTVICLGGPHTSVLPEAALNYNYIDIVVLGEGEFTFLELCQSLRSGLKLPFNIKGTAQRSNSHILKINRKRIDNLDILPFPARHLMPLNLYNIPGTILTSRGCPFGCGFCAGPAVFGKRYIARSAENVVKEVTVCVDIFHLTSFYFVDDTMTNDIKRIFEICERLKKLQIPKSYGRRLKWTCESRADIVSIELLQEMHTAGCTTIQFGMESGSQQLIDHLGKKITLRQIENSVKWSRQVGISPVLSMVFPHPYETEETLKQTFDFIRRLYDLGAEKIVPALLTLFPGTKFDEQKDILGIRQLTCDTDEYNLGTPVLTTRNFDQNLIANAYSQILMLTQQLGGNEIGGISISS